MIKKIFAYQRLMFYIGSVNSTDNKNSLTVFKFIFLLAIMLVMNRVVFGRDSQLGNSPIVILPVICVWTTNIIFHEKERLFEQVPVSRKFTVLNTFMFSFMVGLLGYIIMLIIGFGFVGIIFGFLYLFVPEGTSEKPPEAIINQVIDTSKADMLMFIILIIILFVGTAIVFIKNKRTRIICYSVSAIVGYGLLYILKLNMPVSPNTGNVDFLESFSIMPQANTILAIVAVIGMVLCVGSMIFANKMYR